MKNGASPGERLLWVLRGLPGSGKSTLARSLAGQSGLILSSDDYFAREGAYKFDVTQLGAAHAWNKQRAAKAIAEGVAIIVIDNTNVQKWEAAFYVHAAIEAGYTVKVAEPNTTWKFDVGELAKRNVHDVPFGAIKKALAKWEYDFDIPDIEKYPMDAKPPWEDRYLPDPAKQMIILRGLPGSGKSTLSKKLAGTEGVIVSADDFFMVDGEYTYDPTKIGEAHRWAQSKAFDLMKRGHPLVLIDNTNTMKWEARPYVSAAYRYRYQISVRQPDTPWAKDPDLLAEKNSHGVPLEGITRMLARWEEDYSPEAIMASKPPSRRKRGRRKGSPSKGDDKGPPLLFLWTGVGDPDLQALKAALDAFPTADGNVFALRFTEKQPKKQSKEESNSEKPTNKEEKTEADGEDDWSACVVSTVQEAKPEMTVSAQSLATAQPDRALLGLCKKHRVQHVALRMVDSGAAPPSSGPDWALLRAQLAAKDGIIVWPTQC